MDKESGHGAFGAEGTLISATVLNILLVTTIVTEIIGPMLTRMTLRRAGEIAGGRGAEELYEPAAD